jgi:Uma2 family endonuclease
MSAATPVTVTLVTAEELLRMPHNGFRYELVKGELRKMVPAGAGHGAIGMNLAGPLSVHVQKNRLGQVFLAETGFVLARNPDTVRAPDIALVRSERLPAAWDRGFFEGPPDLAVEVVSPGDTVDEVEEKVEAWLTAGTNAVWVVNPQRRTVAIHHGAMPIVVLRVGDELDGGDIVPGFRCPLTEIFSLQHS